MNPLTAKILVIDDEKPICLSCRKILLEEGHKVEFETSGRGGVRRALEGDFDLVLLDLKMPDLSGMEALDIIKKERPDVSVIIITGYSTIETSVEAIKRGAFHYVPKPFTPSELSVAVMQALEDRQVKHQNEYLKMELVRLREKMKILGRSREMEDIRRQILRIAPTGFTVTIYGESGTGKELIAQAIHDHGLGPERPFVAVDISALVSTLVESELFGHVKGAFTGATQNRPGYFTLANGGTLFLDEIGNMAWEVQGKLLRVLETRRVRPVGSELEHEINVRVIAATNRDLHSLVEQGRFREDLYYRLNVIPFRLPPLRERSEDIPVLAMHFLEKARTLTPARVEGFTTEAMARLMAYGWPGNVRELRNVVERLVATVDAPLLKVEHLPGELRPAPERVAVAGGGAAPKTLEELKEAKRKLKEQLSDKVEKDFVLAALDRAAWNVTRAAALVGMQRTNFHALMRKHDVKLPKTQ